MLEDKSYKRHTHAAGRKMERERESMLAVRFVVPCGEGDGGEASAWLLMWYLIYALILTRTQRATSPQAKCQRRLRFPDMPSRLWMTLGSIP